MLTLTVIIVATKLRCRARASPRGGAEGNKNEDSEDDEEGQGGGERKSSAEEKLMTMMRPDCEELAKEALSLQQQQQHLPHQLFGVSSSHEAG